MPESLIPALILAGPLAVGAVTGWLRGARTERDVRRLAHAVVWFAGPCVVVLAWIRTGQIGPAGDAIPSAEVAGYLWLTTHGWFWSFSLLVMGALFSAPGLKRMALLQGWSLPKAAVCLTSGEGGALLVILSWSLDDNVLLLVLAATWITFSYGFFRPLLMPGTLTRRLVRVALQPVLWLGLAPLAVPALRPEALWDAAGWSQSALDLASHALGWTALAYGALALAAWGAMALQAGFPPVIAWVLSSCRAFWRLVVAWTLAIMLFDGLSAVGTASVLAALAPTLALPPVPNGRALAATQGALPLRPSTHLPDLVWLCVASLWLALAW